MFGSKNNSVGIIGLGIIGSRVADRLRNADYNVFVWNRSIKPAPNFMASPAEVAEVAPVIQIFVRDAEALIAVMEDMKPSLTPQHVVLCHSTVNARAIRRAAAIAAEVGAGFLDAPFTGSKTAAEQGQLVYYIGGEAAELEKARTVLNITGKKIITLGKAGDATVLKIATNLISAAVVEALAEAMAITKAEGIEIAKLQEALVDNANSSALIHMKLPTMAARSYGPHFSLKNMLKDARYAQAIADEKGLALPVLNAAAQAMDRGVRSGQGDFDYSVVMENFSPVLRALEERAAKNKPAPKVEVATPPVPGEGVSLVKDKDTTPAAEAPKEAKPGKLVPASLAADKEEMPAEAKADTKAKGKKSKADKEEKPSAKAEVSAPADDSKSNKIDLAKPEDGEAKTEAAAEAKADAPVAEKSGASESAPAPTLVTEKAEPESSLTSLKLSPLALAAEELATEPEAKQEKVEEKTPESKETPEKKESETPALETKEKEQTVPSPDASESKDTAKPDGEPPVAVVAEAGAAPKVEPDKAAVEAVTAAAEPEAKKEEPAKPAAPEPTASGLPKPPLIAKAGLKPTAPSLTPPPDEVEKEVPQGKSKPGKKAAKAEDKPKEPAEAAKGQQSQKLQVTAPVKKASLVSRLFGGLMGKKGKKVQPAPAHAHPAPTAPNGTASKGKPAEVAPVPGLISGKLTDDTSSLTSRLSSGPLAAILRGEDEDAAKADEAVTAKVEEGSTPETAESTPPVVVAAEAKTDAVAADSTPAPEPEPAPAPEPAKPLLPFDESKTSEDIAREVAAKLSAFPKMPERKAPEPVAEPEPPSIPAEKPLEAPQTRLTGTLGVVVPTLAPAPPPPVAVKAPEPVATEAAFAEPAPAVVDTQGEAAEVEDEGDEDEISDSDDAGSVEAEAEADPEPEAVASTAAGSSEESPKSSGKGSRRSRKRSRGGQPQA